MYICAILISKHEYPWPKYLQNKCTMAMLSIIEKCNAKDLVNTRLIRI